MVVSDEHAALTTIVVSSSAPRRRVSALAKRVRVLAAPVSRQRSIGPKSGEGGPLLDLRWLMKKLGAENVTSLLVEGGGEVNASFLLGGLARRIAFFYAPKILGGRDARKAVAGEGVSRLSAAIQLREVEWRKVGPDLWLSAKVSNP
jgi:diaminohydroxyphosphoribosylaminopyrimidine deaminase/5-amino-6-(5-phosphoribosylamino)uracil reductase